MSMVYLDGRKVSVEMIDPAKHRFIGSFRPPQQPDTRFTREDGTVEYAAVMVCGCGRHLWDVQSVGEHWRQGHMDTPQYVTVEKVTPQEFDRTIASLTAEVDRLTGYSERLNGLRERLEDRNAALTTALEAAKRMLDGARVIHCRDCSPDMEMQGVPCPGVNIGARFRTEQEMHAAWRKRAEEAEQSLLAKEAERDALRSALQQIAGYGQDGICPYGCDAPNVAGVALRRE